MENKEKIEELKEEKKMYILNEDEISIQKLEQQLMRYRMTLTNLLEDGEKTLKSRLKAAEEKEKSIAEKEKKMQEKADVLTEREKKVENELREIKLIKEEIDEKLKKIEQLEDKWRDWKTEEENLIKMATKGAEKRVGVSIDEDVKKLLRILDELLGELPDETLDRFSKSDDYKLYTKVLDNYGIH